MKTCRHSPAQGFTLVEVIVSLGIFAFAIVVVISSLGTSGSYAANDARRTLAVEILHTCFRDLDQTKTPGTTTTPVLGLTPIKWADSPAKVKLWFDANGKRVTGDKDAFFTCDLTPALDPTGLLGHLHGRIVWPARRTTKVNDGDVELFTSLLLP